MSEHAVGYDGERRRLLTFGGTHAVPERCDFPAPDYTDETWAFDDRCGTWSPLEGDGPSPRARHAGTSGGGAFWIFGGRFRAPGSTNGAYTLLDELWRFEFARDAWQRVRVSSGPSARVNSALAWDDRRGSVWLFGGNESADGARYAPLADLWSFDPEAGVWQEVPTDGGPPARLLHAMAYDAVRDALIVFGGANETAFLDEAHYFSDVWSFGLDAREWTRLAPDDSGPAGRFGSALLVPRDRSAYVVVGGHANSVLGNLNDVWNFDPVVAHWTELGASDAFHAEAHGFCDFPAEFARVVPGTPERRSVFAASWSDACDHGLVFGGKTDCGATDDVWQLAPDGVWTERVPASEGEVCHRWRDSPDQCSNLCN